MPTNEIIIRLFCMVDDIMGIFSINRGASHVLTQEAPRLSSLARSSMISLSGGI